MTGLGDGHVRFRNPPAVETLQGVFFRSLPHFTCAHQVLLWAECFRQEFPLVEEKGCLEQIEERFGDGVLSTPTIRWKVSDRPETPRIWARSENGNNVLQIQRDAILTNWLKLGLEDEYRNYEVRRVDFEIKLRMVDQFLRRENLGELEPTSCLLTYVNHVTIDSLAKEPEAAAEIFAFWSNETSEGWLPKPDHLAVNVSYPMGANKGRLNVSVVPAIHTGSGGQSFIMKFELAARGRPEQNTIESALAWLDLGHEWIVKGFVDITRKQWHAIGKWERFT